MTYQEINMLSNKTFKKLDVKIIVSNCEGKQICDEFVKCESKLF